MNDLSVFLLSLHVVCLCLLRNYVVKRLVSLMQSSIVVKRLVVVSTRHSKSNSVFFLLLRLRSCVVVRKSDSVY